MGVQYFSRGNQTHYWAFTLQRIKRLDERKAFNFESELVELNVVKVGVDLFPRS
jgi:hypothetical protein